MLCSYSIEPAYPLVYLQQESVPDGNSRVFSLMYLIILDCCVIGCLHMTNNNLMLFFTTVGLKCQDFPGPGSQQHLNTVTNPISELLHDSGEVDNEFEKFKTTHGKSYHDPKEHEARKANFRHNFR